MNKKKLKNIALIPFYSKGDPSNELKKLNKTIEVLKKFVDNIYIVEDGSRVLKKISKDQRIIMMPNNKGKAEAIRIGIKHILDEEKNINSILQIDADLEHSPLDAKILLNKFNDIKKTTKKPILIIGDRYPRNKSEIVEYRRCILLIEKLTSQNLNCKIRDLVSGIRIYDNKLAKHILSLSKSKDYGIEIEQYIIAFLVEAIVDSTYLTFYSRPESKSTLTNKLLMNFETILSYRASLTEKGKKNVVDFYSNLSSNLIKRSPSFKVDLNVLGLNQTIKFIKVKNDRYTIASESK